MTTLNPEPYDAEIFKKALSNALRRKEYHIAPPSKKQEMVEKEYARIYKKEKEKNREKNTDDRKLGPKEVVSFEELLISNTIAQEALINLLERKGIINKKELLEEIKD